MRHLRLVCFIPYLCFLSICTKSGDAGKSVVPVDTPRAADSLAGPCASPCDWIPGPAHPAGTTPIPSSISLDSLHKGMVHVPLQNTSFYMGNKDSLVPKDSMCRPRHIVRFTYDLWMDRTEVTVQEFARAMTWARRVRNLIKIETKSDGLRMAWSVDSIHRLFGISSIGMASSSDYITFNASTDGFSAVTGSPYPMNDASWHAAMISANYRSGQWGLEPVYDLTAWTTDFSKNGFRLPTEAEYEFALRGGVPDFWTYFWGSGWSMNRARQYSNQTHDLEPVASNSPNPYGIYDLFDQVYQWTND
jgi:formylglycine-generating enzyme required for sulfatase activity